MLFKRASGQSSRSLVTQAEVTLQGTLESPALQRYKSINSV